ncbi:hypothetical protein D3C72_889800 [compost metagenome]
MDEHSHTLDRFSTYHLFGDALNAIRDIKLGHAYVRLGLPYQFWHVKQLHPL